MVDRVHVHEIQIRHGWKFRPAKEWKDHSELLRRHGLYFIDPVRVIGFVPIQNCGNRGKRLGWPSGWSFPGENEVEKHDFSCRNMPRQLMRCHRFRVPRITL